MIIKLFDKKVTKKSRMKKTVKYLRFENLKLELQEKHPKEVSRAIMCFKDDCT